MDGIEDLSFISIAGFGAGRRAGVTGERAGTASVGRMTAGMVMEAPKLFRTSARSVRSMVGAPSKLPLVQLLVVLPELFSTIARSERPTVPSRVASPGRADVVVMLVVPEMAPALA